MSEDYHSYTRVNRFEKKRKSTKAISWLLVVGSVLAIFLIGMIVFNQDDENQVQTVSGDNQSADETEDEQNRQDNKREDTNDDSVESNGDEGVDSNPAYNQPELEPVYSDDENVIEAYSGNWEPVETSQEGPHVVSFDQGSQDWEEMMTAVRKATGLTKDNMIEWWVDRNGDQKIIATVSNRSESEIYRVYVSWIDNQGWMPTKVERLKENDQKYRFEDSSDETTEEVTE